jgi:hypothetical protein
LRGKELPPYKLVITRGPGEILGMTVRGPGAYEFHMTGGAGFRRGAGS